MKIEDVVIIKKVLIKKGRSAGTVKRVVDIKAGEKWSNTTADQLIKLGCQELDYTGAKA